jgi:hypothetical protein
MMTWYVASLNTRRHVMYRILMRKTIEDLEGAVSAYQAQGWTAQGGIAVITIERKISICTGYEFYQAVVKEDD